MKRALTKRYGKDKAREMRREAQTTATEFFSDRRDSQEMPGLPGMPASPTSPK